MTRLGTILRQQTRHFHDLDRIYITPAGMAAMDAYDLDAEKAAETAVQGAQDAAEPLLEHSPATDDAKGN